MDQLKPLEHMKADSNKAIVRTLPMEMIFVIYSREIGIESCTVNLFGD